jgi:predicted Zn-ribbon and HTH transcriptional regulator
MTLRKQLIEYLADEPRSISRLARELGLPRSDVEDALRHMIRSARAAGHRIVVVPARCRSCGFTFGEDKLTKPGKCPECRNSRIFEPQIGIETT